MFASQRRVFIEQPPKIIPQILVPCKGAHGLIKTSINSIVRANEIKKLLPGGLRL